MGRRDDILVPSRFLLTTGHFIAVILAVFSQSSNVGAEATSANSASIASSLQAAIALSLISIAIQLIGLIGGFTLLHARLNVFHSLLNFFGGVLTAWFIADVWAATSYWPISIFFAIIPGIIELAVIFLFRR
jgi:hypothetical protein